MSETGDVSPSRVVGALTINVLGLVLGELANLQFTVGGLGGAVTAREIVDDETQDVVARNTVIKDRLELVDVLNGIEPQEATDLSNLLGLLSRGLIHGRESRLDLTPVEAVGVEGVLLPDVGAGIELDSGRAASGALLGGGARGGEGRGGKGQRGELRELHFGWNLHWNLLVKEWLSRIFFLSCIGRRVAGLYTRTEPHSPFEQNLGWDHVTPCHTMSTPCRLAKRWLVWLQDCPAGSTGQSEPSQ